jgi:predicted DNA-binding transcriptional regulator AlpA
MTHPDRLALRPREAAALLSISERTLWSLTAPRGPIPCKRLPGSRLVLYSVADLQRWLESGSDHPQEGGGA